MVVSMCVHACMHACMHVCVCTGLNSGFLLSVAIAGTMNPKAGTTYHAQPMAESLRITDSVCEYTRNVYII